MKKLFLLLFPVIAQAQVQQEINVLFLGNSYIATNNLPQLISQCAESINRTVTYASNTPGGHRFSDHLTNTTTRSLIAQGNWDFVVLQEQSQIPSFPPAQVEDQCFPFAAQLNDSILHYNDCAETVFYMTWGRENGDAQNCPNWPPVCTYEGMDDLLNERYRTMAENNQAILSPVGALWRSLRENHPEIELYSGDGSHPSVAGSYAAAVCFTSALFRIDPTEITYSAGLNGSTASLIREAAKEIVFDQLLEEWHIGEYDDPGNPCFLVVSTPEKEQKQPLKTTAVFKDGIIRLTLPSNATGIEVFDLTGRRIHASGVSGKTGTEIPVSARFCILRVRHASGQTENIKLYDIQ